MEKKCRRSLVFFGVLIAVFLLAIGVKPAYAEEDKVQLRLTFDFAPEPGRGHTWLGSTPMERLDPVEKKLVDAWTNLTIKVTDSQGHVFESPKEVFFGGGTPYLRDGGKYDEGEELTIEVEPSGLPNGYHISWNGDDSYHKLEYLEGYYKIKYKITKSAMNAKLFYIPMGSMSVKFYLMGGTSSTGSSPIVKVVNKDNSVDFPAEPTKENLHFGGWFTRSGDYYRIWTQADSFSDLNRDWWQYNDVRIDPLYDGFFVLRARWDAHVTFDSDGGSEVEPAKVEEGRLLTYPRIPTKKNARFLYWETEDGETYDFSQPVTKDLKLKAQWLDLHSNDPKGINVSVEQGEPFNPEDGIANKDKLPAGTKITSKEKVDTNTPGTKDVTLVVTYPDGTIKEVVIKVTVRKKCPENTPCPGSSTTSHHYIERMGGTDRIDTAVAFSNYQFTKAKTVIIARSDLYPDALTASVLAKVKNAPILLTPSTVLDKRVAGEIRRLGVSEVIIVGGESAISREVEKALEAFDSDKVQRFDGKDRYETSSLVAREVAGLVDIRGKAMVTTGENWPDALSVSAFAARDNHPILLVSKNKIDPLVQKTMTDLKINQVYLVGGDDAVSEAVTNNLPNVIARFAGKNRFETATLVADYAFGHAKGVYLASGEVFADALIVGPVAGAQGVPILLTRSNLLSPETKAFIGKHSPEWITIVGGTDRIQPTVQKELRGLIAPSLNK